MALHKMIRLFTISLAGQAYLNFMGNEFGHPEWIDFPREGNGWSYAHARRLWSLAENGFLRYSYLGAFDRAMLKLVRKYDILGSGYAYNHLMDTANQTLAFSHGTTVFVFNWHPRNSIPDYAIPVPEPGRYRIVLTSDAPEFGGYGRIDPAVKAFSFSQTDSDGSTRPYIRIYNLCRSALVLTRMNR
jgi:1,4-alpha-glucan-branching enzyme